MAKERLTDERKGQLEQLYADLRRHNFYTILGVRPDASRADIRKGYFAISKLCHPDNYAETDLGEHQVYMEKIFQACSKAYDVLSNAKKRTRYDEYLAKKADTADYATNVLGGSRTADQAEQTEAGVPGEQASSRSVLPSSPVRERTVARRETDVIPPLQQPPQMQQPVVNRIVPTPAAGLDASTRKAHDERRKAWRQSAARRGLAGTLGNVQDLDKARRGRSWIDQAKQARDEGQTLGALNALRMAVDSDPENEEARTLLAEVMGSASGELGKRYFDQARAELEFGEPQLAQASILKAVSLLPEEPETLATAASILLSTDGDLHRAHDFIQKASLARPGNARYLLVLGKILVKAGLTSRARSVLTQVVALDPRIEEAKTILARL